MNELKNILYSYVSQLNVPVFKDKYQADLKTERIVINIVTLNGNTWQEGYANINYYIPNILSNGFYYPDGIKLLQAEESLKSLFNHGVLLPNEVYARIDRLEQIEEEFSTFINLRLHIQKSNF